MGWNEGINTSASLSYLLGTSFRQLPSNESKRLDIIPVDSVCRGMTLIAAAIIERRHEPLYQLATSVTNPCDMRRSIELTSLAHRKHYRAQEGLEYWLRLRLGRHSGFQGTLPPHVGAGAEGDREIHSAHHVAAAVEKDPLVRAERNLERVEKLIELFEPFILQTNMTSSPTTWKGFRTRWPEDEKAAFRLRHPRRLTGGSTGSIFISRRCANGPIL